VDYDTYWNKSESVHFKQYLLETHHSVLPDVLIFEAFKTDTIPVRQTLANVLYGVSGARKTSAELKSRYESLLDDKSYLTKEIALLKLWTHFPENRTSYLEQTKDVVGLPNKNVRLLWLTLALVTPAYKNGAKATYLNELMNYTTSTYHWEVRQTAFQYLNHINAMNTEEIRKLNSKFKS